MKFSTLLFGRLRNRTLAFFLFTGLTPTLLISAYLLVKVRTDLLENVMQTQRHSIETIRNAVSHHLMSYERGLLTLGEEMDVQSLEPERMARAMSQFLFLSDLFYNVFFFDLEGMLLWAEYKDRYQGNRYLLGKNVLTQEQEDFDDIKENLLQLKKTGQNLRLWWTDPQQQRTYLQIMTPVYSFEDPATLIGMLSARIRLKSFELEEMLSFYPLAAGEYLVIADLEGSVFVELGKVADRPLRRLRFVSEEERLDERTVGSGRFTIEGNEHLISFSAIAGFDLFIAIGQPYDQVVAFLRHLLNSLAVQILLAVILVVLLGVYFSDHLSAPILALVEGINRVGAGDTSHRIAIARDDELGQASAAFNTMASNLQRQRFLESIWKRTWRERD